MIPSSELEGAGFVRVLAAAIVLVLVVCCGSASALTAPKVSMRGDVGFSVTTSPSECSGISTGDIVVRVYGDTYTSTIPSSLKLGTFISINGGKKQWWFKPFDSTSASKLNSASVSDPAYPSDPTKRVKSSDLMWPGTPFLAKAADGKLCKLVIFGDHMRKSSSSVGYGTVTGHSIKVSVDIRTMSSSPTTAPKTWSVEYGSRVWDAGAVDSVEAGLLNRRYLLGPSLDGSKSKVMIGAIDTENGSVAPLTTGGTATKIDLPVTSSSGSKLLSTFAGRGSVVQDDQSRWWFVSSPGAYSTLVFAQRLDSDVGPVSTNSSGQPLAAKLLVNLADSFVPKALGCVVYDPIVHMGDRLSDGTAGFSFSINASSAAPKCSGAYGNVRLPGFWPYTLNAAYESLRTKPVENPDVSTGSPTIDIPSAGDRKAVDGSLADDAAGVNQDSSNFKGVIDSRLALDPSLPNLAAPETGNFEIACTFVVPNSVDEYFQQQTAAKAAVLAIQLKRTALANQAAKDNLAARAEADLARVKASPRSTPSQIARAQSARDAAVAAAAGAKTVADNSVANARSAQLLACSGWAIGRAVATRSVNPRGR